MKNIIKYFIFVLIFFVPFICSAEVLLQSQTNARSSDNNLTSYALAQKISINEIYVGTYQVTHVKVYLQGSGSWSDITGRLELSESLCGTKLAYSSVFDVSPYASGQQLYDIYFDEPWEITQSSFYIYARCMTSGNHCYRVSIGNLKTERYKRDDTCGDDSSNYSFRYYVYGEEIPQSEEEEQINNDIIIATNEKRGVIPALVFLALVFFIPLVLI